MSRLCPTEILISQASQAYGIVEFRFDNLKLKALDADRMKPGRVPLSGREVGRHQQPVT
jgi:hypothetical protein